jgi:hypothetical protein
LLLAVIRVNNPMEQIGYRIIPCTHEHVAYLGAMMPEIQKREITIWGRDNPAHELHQIWQQSLASWTLLFDDQIAAGYGVVGSLLDPIWGGWLVTTDVFRAVQSLSLVRGARKEIIRVAGDRTVTAMIPEFYPETIRFLKLIGFRPYGTVAAPSGDRCQMLRYSHDE